MPITALALLLLWASVRLYSKHAAEIVDEL
jgi:hypothetical protein